MVFAILKLSYNDAGDSTLEGGICGTGFFIKERTAVTAYHVLNTNTFQPNVGHRNCKVWLLSRPGSILSLGLENVVEIPEADTSIINVDERPSDLPVYTCAQNDVDVGRAVKGLGHIGNSMPRLQATWEANVLAIKNGDLMSVTSDMKGKIVNQLMYSISAQDVNLQDIKGYEVSFSSRIGMSGGPLLDAATNNVLGLLSFGLPPDAAVKTKTFVVLIDEIVRRI
jgi:hypothetical protein